MDKKSNSSNFQFLKEGPLTENLQFGHREITETLRKIISDSPTNLTIGLFGGWGTGKSSIVESLNKELLRSSIPMIVFDVWKHEGDALRRTFLKELDKQLSAPPYGNHYVTSRNILDPRVYSSSSSVTEMYKLYFPKLKLHLLLLFTFSLVITIPLFVMFAICSLIFNVNIFNGINTGSITSIISTSIAGGFLFKYLDSFIKTDKIDYKQDRLQDPHEFENEFDKLIQNLKDDKNRIVITFDNLDRVSGDSALKIISTIKTFLDYKNTDSTKTVIFLIPCDVSAIKKHVSSPLLNDDSESELYIDEFLRKFFNTSLWIPEFYTTELESFAMQKLEETNILEFKNDIFLG